MDIIISLLLVECIYPTYVRGGKEQKTENFHRNLKYVLRPLESRAIYDSKSYTRI